MGAKEIYREIILDNIEYDILIQDPKLDRERLDEIAELIVDTVCSARDNPHSRGRLPGGGGQIPLYEAGQLPCAVCHGLHGG